MTKTISKRQWIKKFLNCCKNYWLFVLAVAIYIGSYAYQSGAVLRDAPLQHHEIIKIPSQALEVSITYPQRLRVDNGQVASAIITLKHNQPVSPTLTYIVNWILPPEYVILTNKEGERITGRFVLTPTMQYPASVTFNMQHILSTKAPLSPLQPILLIQTPTELTTKVLPDITTPTLYKIWWFGFWDLVFGPATPLISAAAGLMVLAVKKIQDLANKRLRDAESRKQIQDELSRWEDLLKTNLSEGARQYVRFRRREGDLWKAGEFGQQELRRIWEQQDSHLRNAIAALEFPYDQLQPEPAILVLALKWVQANLDEEWRAKAFAKLLEKGYVETEDHLFYNMLRVWPHCAFGRKLQLESEFPDKVGAVLTTIAERDGLWFQSRFTQASWFTEFRDSCPVWAYGPPGCGKTTTALWLLRETARRDPGDFNVYCSLTQVTGISNLEDITRAVAHTLLHYFALDSSAFLQMDWHIQHLLTQLWLQYASPDVCSALYTAGLTPYGEGARLLDRVNRLLAETSLAPLLLAHLPRRLFDVCPPRFTRLTVLLDVQAPLTDSEQEALFQLGEALHQAGIGIKILAPEDSLDIELPRWWHSVQLTWTEADLSALLRGLKIDSLDSWCNPDAIGLQAEARLLAVSQGTPRGLLQKLIELQQRIEKNNAPLSLQDLDDILGPAPIVAENPNV